MKVNAIERVSDETIRAIASVELINGDVLSNIKIVASDNGLFVVIPLPSNLENKDYTDMTDEEVIQYDKYMNNLYGIEKLVMDAYYKL